MNESHQSVAERISANRRRDFASRAKMASNDEYVRNVRKLFSR